MIKKILNILPAFIFIFVATNCSSSFNSEKEMSNGVILYDKISDSDVPWIEYAKSVEGREIYLAEFGTGDSITIIFGGFHGNETHGVQLVEGFAEYLYKHYYGSFNSRVIIIPAVNPDGLIQNTRRNANEVDINRNFPTENWNNGNRNGIDIHGSTPASEPETKAVIELLKKYKPQRIVTVHAPLEVVNYDGPAHGLAVNMANYNNYPVNSDIGYATPGSFGTYAGKELKIPTITLELPRGSFEDMWHVNKMSLLSSIIY